MAEISYTKTNWVNNVTKLNADNMNHIESGVEAACSHIDATPISKGTGTNSLVGNDLTTNSAISENVTSFGTGNIGGLKGYYWSTINLSAKTITLASAHTGGTPVNCEYAVGDTISIVNGAKYNNCSRITAISSNVVTVDSFPFTKIESETPAFDNYCIYCNAKPAIGTADLGKNAVVFGDNNKSGNRSSFIAGRDNAGVGQYAFAAGRGNTVAYASFAAGRNNNISHDYSCGIGWNNTSGGRVSTLIGYGNTGRGNYNFLIGASNDTTNNVTEQISIGFANHSEAKTTFSIGKNNKHYSPNGIAIGKNNIGQGGVCLGDNNIVGENQYTVGKNNRENFKVANVYRFGESLQPNDDQTIVGRYNKQLPSTTSFIVGVGTSDTDRKNGMWVTTDGNIVVGGPELILNGNGTQFALDVDRHGVLSVNNSVNVLGQLAISCGADAISISEGNIQTVRETDGNIALYLARGGSEISLSSENGGQIKFGSTDSAITGISDNKGTSSTIAVSQKCLNDNYLPLTGGIISGALTIDSNNNGVNISNSGIMFNPGSGDVVYLPKSSCKSLSNRAYIHQYKLIKSPNILIVQHGSDSNQLTNNPIGVYATDGQIGYLYNGTTTEPVLVKKLYDSEYHIPTGIQCLNFAEQVVTTFEYDQTTVTDIII